MMSLSSCERDSFTGAIVHRRAHASRRRPYCVGLLKLLIEVPVATSQAVGELVNAKGNNRTVNNLRCRGSIAGGRGHCKGQTLLRHIRGSASRIVPRTVPLDCR
jgi:hypothetical protein